MLLPVHGSPGKLRRLQSVVEIPLAFRISKQENLIGLTEGDHYFQQLTRNESNNAPKSVESKNYLRIGANKSNASSRVYLGSAKSTEFSPGIPKPYIN
jgi:hypothetical protein